jgi:small conductance mechanosensitive channel
LIRRREVIEAEDHVLEALKPALMKSGIDLPLPTQQVLFHDQTEETDGERKRQREGWPSRSDDPRPRQARAQERG